MSNSMEQSARRRGWLVAVSGVGIGLVVRGAALAFALRGGDGSRSLDQVAFIFASLIVGAGLVMSVRTDRATISRGLAQAAALRTAALLLLTWVALVQPSPSPDPLPATQRVMAPRPAHSGRAPP